MKILLCVEFFYPSVGGAQEVIKQLALRFSRNSHQITVATSYLPNRTSAKFNDVAIVDFKVSGNYVIGLSGDVKSYQKYVIESDFDVVLIYAAQQWTFDGLIPVLDKIKAKKFFVPCGYSALYDGAYKAYFKFLPNVLDKFNACIYHSIQYRDYQFAKKNKIKNSIFIPNGANLDEFIQMDQKEAKIALGINKKNYLLMTVGTLNESKGHLELAKAFAKLEFSKPVTLLLSGGRMTSANFSLASTSFNTKIFKQRLNLLLESPFIFFKKAFVKFKNYFIEKETLFSLVNSINNKKYGAHKNVLLVDLDRPKLIQAFYAADIFLFASNIEYSPLVLFEACASGTPFISSDVGNSREIAKWTKGGMIAKTKFISSNSYIDETELNAMVLKLFRNKKLAKELSISGKKAILLKFNWRKISKQYMDLFES